MAFSNPIIGASDALVREAIQSPNFVAGVSGWRIGKNGSAEFNDLTVRGDLIVDGDDPMEIKIYNSAGNPVIQIIDGEGRLFALIGGAGGGLKVGDPAAASTQFNIREDAGGTFDSLWFNASSPINGFLRGPSLKPERGWLVPHDAYVQESWTALTYANGWTNTGGVYQTGRYRMGPDGFVTLEGLLTPGTTTNGTTVFTLPVGYRPSANHIFKCNDGSGNGSVGMIISSGGVGSVWGAGAGGVSISGIRFAVSTLT